MTLQRPLRDGRTALVFAPGEFVRRLATLIPPPRSHLTRYHGVFAPHHALRAAVVPAQATPCADDPTPRAGPLRRLAWAALMKRVFAIDVLSCDTCGGASHTSNFRVYHAATTNALPKNRWSSLLCGFG
jgi:hypothetical protein